MVEVLNAIYEQDFLDCSYGCPEDKPRKSVSRSTISGEDHTLRYILTFAAGIDVGVGVGMLSAPASGEGSRSAIAGKVRDVSDRVKNISSEGDLATGTYTSPNQALFRFSPAERSAEAALARWGVVE
jgi:hypothetical protein